MIQNERLVEAVSALQEEIDSGDPDRASGAAIILGILRLKLGDNAGAREAFQTAMDSGHPDHSPRGAVMVGIRLMEQDDFNGAHEAYEDAIDSCHPDHAPSAWVMMGMLFERQGKPADARGAYQAAINSGHASYAPLAAVGMGLLLEAQGDSVGARAAYQTAADSGHPDHAAFAVLLIGEHFTDDDLPTRFHHRDAAAHYGNPDVLLSIAELYLAEGAVPKARQLLQQAAAAGSTVAAHSTQMFAPDAILSASKRSSLAVLKSAQQGDTDSMNLLGLHAATHGDLVEARSWWTKSARQRDVIAPLLLSRHLH